MEDRRGRRWLAHLLRAAGLALMAGSLIAALFQSDVRFAVAQVLPVPGLGTPVPKGTATPSPKPGAVAPPDVLTRATPVPKAGLTRGGPLTFAISGNLSLGERTSSSNRGDAASPGGVVVTSQNQATDTAGLLVQLQRRTGTTTLSLGMPLGVSTSQRTTLGQLQAGFYTSHYGLQYMPQPLTVLGGVALGSTLAGLSLVLPLPGGDVSAYEGNGPIDIGSTARVYGVRARALLGQDLYELGYSSAARTDHQGRVDSVVAGFAGNSGDFDQLFEGALQRRRDESGSRSTSAAQYRFDYGGQSVYSTFALKHVGDGFSSVGSGNVLADDQISAAYRSGPFSIQETLDRGGASDAQTSSRQGTVSYMKTFGRQSQLSTMWTLSDQRSASPFGTLWLGSAGLQLGTNVRDLNALAQLQSTRSTSDGAGAITSFTAQGTLQKPLGSSVAQLQIGRTRQSGADTFNLQTQAGISITRTLGLTSLTFSDTLTRSQTPVTDVLTSGPLLTVARRLSPVLSLGVSYGLEATRDGLNPSGNGRSQLFNVQLTAPFSIGNGLVQGRVNPRLPATISGSVLNDVGDRGSFSSAVNDGVGNVMVMLDGSQVQRTDLSGRFQFNFVPPGHHTLQLQIASLPRGVTPDQPIAGIDVQGGQQGQVFFRIGTYGGVQGHVFGRDSSGDLVPLSGVTVTVDSAGGLAVTGPDGLFGFGRLSAGAHVVAVSASSLPASVSLSPDQLSQKVNVRNGELTRVDFTGKPLGSIAGFVVFDPSLAPLLKGGVLNAYVVAEPGDYAAITNDDGSFLLDNIPAGTYSVDLDPETVPADTGNIGGAQSVTVGSDAHVEGVRFVVGHKLKNIVFSLKLAQEPTGTIALQETALPPGGATEVAVSAGSGTKSVVLTAFGKTQRLLFDPKRKKWVGIVAVPLSTPAGSQAILADVQGGSGGTLSTDLKVDPAITLATFTMTPRRPVHGQYVQVRARFLADVHPGDTIRWNDGQITKLRRPITGRVYEFTVKISVQPMSGLLLTARGELPITLR